MPVKSKGLYFNPAENTYVTCNYSLPALFPNMTKEFTMMIWFKPYTSGQIAGLAVHYWYAWARLSLEGSPVIFRLPVWSADGVLKHYAVNDPIKANKNYCGVATYKYDDKARLWLFHEDGTYSYSEDAAIGELSSTTSKLTLGEWLTSGIYKYYGEISQFLAYNRVLTEDEIMWNYKNPDNPIRDGLVTWLPAKRRYGKRLIDYSGYGNHGEINNARWVPQWRRGLRFYRRLNSHIYVDTSDSLNVTDKLSMFVWVKPTGSKSWGGLVSTKQSYLNKGQFDFMCGWATNASFVELLFSDGTTAHIGCTTWEEDIWYMMGFTFNKDSGIVRTIADGKVTNEVGGYAKSLHPMSGGLYIGSRRFDPVDGDIAMVIMYNRELSEEEIWQLYLDPDNPPARENIVLWLPLKEKNGYMVYDWSGNENHGYCYNVRWI